MVRVDEGIAVNKPPAADEQGSSTRPYLIRALHEWCTDNGFTPYVAVHVTSAVQVPMAYVKNNEIVLNVGFEATSGLKLGNEQIEFRARFGGVSRDIAVPVDHVVAIYARENGQGMAFPVPTAAGATPAVVAPATESGRSGLRLAPMPGTDAAAVPADKPNPEPEPPSPGAGARPSLKRIK